MLLTSMVMGQDIGATATPTAYTEDGRLEFPAQYRQWVYLSSGFDMSYVPGATGAHHLFDNVFVNPQAYRAFLSTGTWPDGTVLVLELRRADSSGSINKQGSYQGSDVVGVEVHTRDSARFKGNWAFFSFSGAAPATGHAAAKMHPFSAECYSCHRAHGAVDSTFVQFYPTLLPIARSKGTLSAR
jgi:hypothetical protein